MTENTGTTPTNQTVTPELVELLKARHGLVVQMRVGDEDLVLRPPTRREWAAFFERAERPRKRLAATEELFRACCVAPIGRDLEELLDRRPALPTSCSEKLLTMAGVELPDDIPATVHRT